MKKCGIKGDELSDKNLKTLTDIMNENGHADSDNLILKMDIEGAEWRALLDTPSSILFRFSQIVVEVHAVVSRCSGDAYSVMVYFFKHMNKDHQIVHVHANNFGGVAIFGGVFVPDVFEITWVRRRDHEFSECFKVFPTDLDMPNNPKFPDIFLGALGAIA